MLKYLIVQIDDSSASFCHYPTPAAERRLIPAEVLEKAVLWAMKENLTIQYVYPDYELPSEYKEIIDRTYHADIVPSLSADKSLVHNADVVVCEDWNRLGGMESSKTQAYVIRSTVADAISNADTVQKALPWVDRLNIVITDVAGFNREADYKAYLDKVADAIAAEYASGHPVQLNLLTDRILLDKMNNCNAGHESITLAPDGKFYICPAFYGDGESVGSVEEGLDIMNPQLYRRDHAPICRRCDAYQCRRCVWLNRRLTLEVNTPGREQCVMAHLERNASRRLLAQIRKIGDFMPGKEIPEIDYLDPFEKVTERI